MNYQNYINKKVINKKNERGHIVSFSEDKVIIRYKDNEVIYNPEIAFKNDYLTFQNSDYQTEYKNYLYEKERADIQKKQNTERNNKEAIEFNKNIVDHYYKINKKNNVMLSLFGNDFTYKPYVLFMKKYKHLIPRICSCGLEITVASTYPRHN